MFFRKYSFIVAKLAGKAADNISSIGIISPPLGYFLFPDPTGEE